MTLVEANVKDRIEDVKLFFGIKIDRYILLSEEVEKNYIFYINTNRYLGGTIDFFRNISEILFYNYDSVWFTETIRGIIEDNKLEGLVPIPEPGKTDIVICFAKEDKEKE